MPTTLIRFQQRRNTATQWTTTNETLLAGEPGYETDTGKWKLGDGTTSWGALPYQGPVTVNAADGRFGSTRTQAQINNAISYVKSLGGGRVLVRRADGPWLIGRNISTDQKAGGILIEGSDITLESDGAVLTLTNNSDFIKVRSVLGARVTVTADTTITDTTITVADTATFTVGGSVFVRLGQASYDAAEPDFWYTAKVTAIPDATHLTLDRPTGYAMTTAAVTNVNQRSVAPISTLTENIGIEGTWNLINPLGGANAETGINLLNVRNVHIDTVIGKDPGAALVGGQFVDNITVNQARVTSAVAQAGQGSKGRGLSFAESRGIRVGLLEAENFERAALVSEGRTEGFRVGEVVLRNTNTNRAAAGGAAAALITSLGKSQIEIGSLHLTGYGSNVYDTVGDINSRCSIGEFYAYTSTRCNFSDLGIVKNRLYIDQTMFVRRRTARYEIPLTASNSTVWTDLPAGHWCDVRIRPSTLTGVTSVTAGSFQPGTTTPINSPNFVAQLVAGQTVAYNFLRGLGSGYGQSYSTAKRILFATDATVPAGAYAVVEIDYWEDQADVTRALGTPLTTSGGSGSAPAAHAASHRPGGSDDLLIIPGQDNPARFEPINWRHASSRPSNTNGAMHLVYFTANAAVPVTTLSCAAGSVASAGATLARMGLYSAASNGDLTLVAVTAADPTILQGATVTFPRTFSTATGLPATVTTTVGQRYALAVLVVGSTTAGNYQGLTIAAGMAALAPRGTGLVTGQTDLPATVPVASIGADGNPPWLALY